MLPCRPGSANKRKTYSDGDVILILGKVKHSYRVSLPLLQPWVVVQNNGTVVCGHCTCVAGLAETCLHVGAVLYWTETAVRIRDGAACTLKKKYMDNAKFCE